MTMIIRPLGNDVTTPTTMSTVDDSIYVRCVNKTSTAGTITNRIENVTRTFELTNQGERLQYTGTVGFPEHSVSLFDGVGNIGNVVAGDIITIITNNITYTSIVNTAGLTSLSIDAIPELTGEDITFQLGVVPGESISVTGLRDIDTEYTIAGNEVLVVAKSIDEQMSTSVNTIELTPVSVTR